MEGGRLIGFRLIEVELYNEPRKLVLEAANIKRTL